MDGDEFQEADILWPDVTPRDEVFLPFAPSEPYDAASASSCAPAFGLDAGRRRFEGSPPFFLARSRSSSTVTARDDEEWQEADVLWPETVGDGSWRGGGDSLWSFGGAFGQTSCRLKPAAPKRERWPQGVSSPIDIPANVAARRLVGAATGRRRL